MTEISANVPNPSMRFAELTPSNGTAVDPVPRAIYVGTGGDVEIKGQDEVAATFVGVPGGTVLPVRPKFLMSTGTTASNIVALY
jgi:hypothetical protein